MTEKSIMAQPISAEWKELKHDPGSLLTRVKRMIVNGTGLKLNECVALVDFCIANDLNPLLGEAYCIPGKGITPGIAGRRRKASEQLYEEMLNAGLLDAHYDIEYVKATHDDAIFDEESGDIAYKAILTDSITHTRWRKNINEAADELHKIFPDVGFFEIMKIAEQQTGPRPKWEASAVVHGVEKFSGLIDWNHPEKGYKPEMFDRIERAKKRAASLVIKARFPGARINSIRLEGELYAQSDNDIDTEYEPVIEEKQEQVRSEHDILNDLGIYPDENCEPEQLKPEEPKKEKIARPMTAEQLKYSIVTRSNKYVGKVPTEAQRSLLVMTLNQIFEGDETKRHNLLAHLLGEGSVKKLNGPLILAMLDWLKPVQDSGGAYTPSAMAEKEAKNAYQDFLTASGQESLFEE